MRQHDIADIEIYNTEFDDDNDDNPYDSENEGEDVDDNAFPELCLEQVDFQIGNIYNAGVFDGKSVVSASATSLVAAAAGVAEASVPPTSGGGRGDGSSGGGGVSGNGGGGGIGYFSGGGSGSGSGSGLGSGNRAYMWGPWY